MSAYRLIGDAFSTYFFERVLPDEPKLADSFRVSEDNIRQAQRLVRDARKTLALRANAKSTENQLLRPLADLLGWAVAAETTIVETVHGEEDGGLVIADIDGEPWARAFCAAPSSDIDATPQGKHRRFALATSIARVLEASSTPYGIALNRQELRLIRRAEGGSSSAIAFDLDALAEWDETSRRGWRLVFGFLRKESLGRPYVLDRVVELGRHEMVGVGTLLGRQVLDAVALFVSGLYANPENRQHLPNAGDEDGLAALYGEALRVLYRCLFALYAEARGLVPVDLPIYRDHYALSTASQGGGSVGGIAARVRALFVLLRRGADLGNGERIPAFSGALFSPEAAPLVEKLAWDDQSVAAMLRKLTRVPSKGGSGEVPVSYRELDEERLGSIYEGLLELRLSLADRPMDRIAVQGRELVIDLAHVAELSGYEWTGTANGAARDREEDAGEPTELGALIEADGDGGGTADDTDRPSAVRGRLVRRLETIPEGTPYLASSSGRKETASYYTARDLVDFLVRETIDPRAERAEPFDILRLRVVDPAMGSGHFLIGAMRRLADHLLAAYRRLEEREGFETLPLFVQAAWDDERELLALCRQLVAVHCLYGVDKNPLAVDLARVALWLATAAANHPLSFLDHRLRCGDSLLGISLTQVVAIEATTAIKTNGKRKGRQYSLLTVGDELVDEIALGHAVSNRLVQAFNVIRGFLAIVDDEKEPFELKRMRADAIRAALEPLQLLHAARIGFLLLGPGDGIAPLLQAFRTFSRLGYLADGDRSALGRFTERAQQERAFCWELEFPEAFYEVCEDGDVRRRDDAGFDVVVGNPPWDKLLLERRAFYARYDPLILDFQGKSADARIARVNGSDSRAPLAYESAATNLAQYAKALSDMDTYFWQTAVVSGSRTGGHPDLFKFFAERDWWLAQPLGSVGVVIPAALTSSDGTTGLRHMLFEHAKLRILFVFENRQRLFPIDSRFKFQIVAFERQGPTRSFEALFWQHSTEILRESRTQRIAKTLSLSLQDVLATSPERLAVLEFRSARDVQIARRMVDAARPLTEVLTSWAVFMGQELNMTTDRGLFNTREQLVAINARRDGETYVGGDKYDVYLPLREGRMVQAFDGNAKRYLRGEGRSAEWAENGWPKGPIEPHYWVRASDIDKKLNKRMHRLYWADVTGATNERTAMAAMVNGPSISGHSLWTMYLDNTDERTAAMLSTVFNSFAFDWYMRLSVAQHMSLNFLEPAPFVTDLQLQGLEDVVDAVSSPTIGYVKRADLRADLDAAVALAYGFSYGDFAHVLASFPLLDRAEPPLEGEVRSTVTRDLALSAYCRLAGEHDPEHADRVRKARKLGALGYVATPLRRKLTTAVTA